MLPTKTLFKTHQSPLIIVLMGVSGCGKSTVGKELALTINSSTYLEADDFHSSTNIQKMSTGIPLTDDDRWPWLESLCKEGRQLVEKGITVIMSCSALKLSYRDYIRNQFKSWNTRLCFFLLYVHDVVLQRRLQQRSSTHYMKVGMLQSQLSTLERPKGDEKDTHTLYVTRLEDSRFIETPTAELIQFIHQIIQRS